jgi:hypothetical protein
MRYIEAPTVYQPRSGEKSLFLAGGITDCPDWQQEVVQMLADTELILINPRRSQFPARDMDAIATQTKWELDHLRLSQEVLFWFPSETLCPITLYELGAWSMTNKRLYLGIHPDYQKLLEVQAQIALVRPDVEMVHSLDDLVAQVKEAYRNNPPPDTGLQSIPLRGSRS